MSSGIMEPPIDEAEAMSFQEELQNGLVFVHEPRVEKHLKTLAVSISALPVRDIVYDSPRCTFSCLDYRNVSYHFAKGNEFFSLIVIEFQTGGGLVNARLSTVDGNFTEIHNWDENNLDQLPATLQTLSLPVSLVNIESCRDAKLFFHLELDFRCEEKLSEGDSCDGMHLDR